MDSNHRAIIKKFKDKVSKNIDLQVLLPHLEESKIFTKAMLDDIKYKNADLYDELPTRGPKAFDKFIDVLKKSEYVSQAELLLLGNSNVQLNECDNIAPHNEIKDIIKSTSEIKLVTSDKNINEPHLTSEDIYKVHSIPRGYCLIINNVDFNGLLEYREGSDVDANSLNKIFTQLGYVVDLKINLDEQSMRDVFSKFSKKEEHKNVDSCIVIILSHGGINDTIYGTDAGKIKLDDILELFDNTNCEYLKSKPKVFILQACRGRRFDSGVLVENADSVKVSTPTESADSCKIPSRSDMLIAYATLTKHVAIRNHLLGSWFIKELAYALLCHSHDTDLYTMLQKVDRAVKKRMTSGGDKQVTEQRTLGFDKKLYFFPIVHNRKLDL